MHPCLDGADGNPLLIRYLLLASAVKKVSREDTTKGLGYLLKNDAHIVRILHVVEKTSAIGEHCLKLRRERRSLERGALALLVVCEARVHQNLIRPG